MYLKKVEIVGFKSFAQKTVLDFFPDASTAGVLAGITAIVGPNGSGKSNVADAIRWAIGEQSSKNLRGKKSEDVIFAGTDTKGRLGAASVTLFFDNTDQRIPLEFAEVSVTRKVYRSGEGEYLINGSRVRLMDVVDLLATAGVGKDSYSVITQGMSDALLRANATERRGMIEDAAGVKQYQIEKERSKRRLLATEENLRQVDALLIELEPHLKNLRRQAEKAGQGSVVAEKLQSKQVFLYGTLWHNFQNERGVLLKERADYEKEVALLEEKTRELEEKVKSLSASLSLGAEEESMLLALQVSQGKINEAEKNIALIEGKIALEQERQKTEEVIRTIPVDLRYVEGALNDIEETQKLLIQDISQATSVDELGALRLRAEAVYGKLTVLRTKAGQGSIEEKTVIALPEAEQLASEERVRDLEEELVTWQKNRAEATEDRERENAMLTASRAQTKSAREQFFETETQWRAQERALMTKKDTLSDLRVRLARVEVREEDLVVMVREDLHCTPDDLAYQATPDQIFDKEQLEREIARLKVEKEHIGTIDPLIVEEYQETETRFSFLQKESLDLRTASASLDEVIQEMDKKIEIAFREAYQHIRKTFAEYFTLIFGGGKADMSLEKIWKKTTGEASDSDELVDEREKSFEYGIEVTACPPGKKITSLSMLSGGERSLTSLALLFAIIAYNPPPFSILDEVEAALDEANSRRFSKMLKELSQHTQFVAITHNRETMKQAALIYGVTMGGDGISQLLSVRLDQALGQEK